MQRKFLVVIHDVAVPYLEPLKQMIDQLAPLVNHELALAVVPRWQGQIWGTRVSELRTLLSGCREYLLHGWTHQRETQCSLISWVTRGADELRGLSLDQTQQRLDQGQDELADLLGEPAAGLLPPAFQLRHAANQLRRLKYVLRYQSIDACEDEALSRSPQRRMIQQPMTQQRLALPKRKALATWSYDWGRVSHAAWPGHWLGNLQRLLRPHAIPCLALHPIDVARGWLPVQVKLVSRLIDQGFTAIVPRDTWSET